MLIVAPSFPLPAHRGEQVVVMGRLQELHRLGAKIHFVCLNPHPVLDSDVELVKRYCEELTVVVHPKWLAALYALGALFTLVVPLQIGYYFSFRTWLKIRRMLRLNHYDAIHVVLLRMAHYVAGRQQSSVIELVDSMALNARVRAGIEVGWRRWIWKEEARRLVKYEQRCIEDFGVCTVVSQRDRSEFARASQSKIEVLPNGLPSLDKAAGDPPSGSFDLTPFITFFGNLSYRFNVEGICRFTREVWPNLSAKYPELRLKIVGANPAPEILALQRLKGVSLHANVASISHEIRGAICSVVPLSAASGLQNKIIESMAAGVPVVATPVACDGLPEAMRSFVGSVSSVSDWLLRISQLIENSEFRAQRSSDSRRVVAETCSWEKAAEWLMSQHLGGHRSFKLRNGRAF